MTFDPNSTATADSGLFGLPHTHAEAKLCLLPVPWEVTTSYGDGTSRGPEAILHASRQVDLFDIETGDLYQHGYFMAPIDEHILNLNDEMKRKALLVSAAIESGQDDTENIHSLRRDVNAASLQLNSWVYKQARALLQEDKIAAVIGGDHSSPFGLIQAVSEKHRGEFGILHIDAHADLREAYQGFQHSHASIMYNVMESDFRPQRLVQVGIRDFSQGEFVYIQAHPDRIRTFFDAPLKRDLNKGRTWQSICNEIAQSLPAKVYISFDIDGLDPVLCPNTGTPVPGGLSFDQMLTLLATLAEAKKQIVGFDLCEVAQPEDSKGEWDGNVGARVLFKLCGWTLHTNGFKRGAL